MLIVNKENSQIFGEELGSCQEKSFDFSGLDFAFVPFRNDFLLVADDIIASGADLVIKALPRCLLLGYDMYIFKGSGDFVKVEKCTRCAYRDFCAGLPRSYHEIVGDLEVVTIGKNLIVSEMEKCMIKILTTENDIPTKRVLELAKQFRICSNCDDGNSVLATGQKLSKRGMVELTLKKGVYYWYLKENAAR
jgi:hypothetical protein